MSAAAEVQSLLRFLTQDARIPLAVALPKVGQLRKSLLNNPENISKASAVDISSIFEDEKQAKQVLSAAKRVTSPKKRPKPDTLTDSSASKRSKTEAGPAQFETDLVLPTTSRPESDLSNVIIQTNRAPLVLAFAVTVLKYTMPEQPLSSRLSLGQAVVSANSQSKAKSIGITNERTAEEDGWAMGQPKVKVMGREIAVMRRATHRQPPAGDDENSYATIKREDGSHDAFWGLDLEALRKANGPPLAGSIAGSGSTLPIHTPQGARNYLLRSFCFVETPGPADRDLNEDKVAAASANKKVTAAEASAKRVEAAGLLLQAIDLVCQSWAPTLSKEDLDRRAWSWYLHVRPEVAQGQAGWGQRGEVRLEDILTLRRRT